MFLMSSIRYTASGVAAEDINTPTPKATCEDIYQNIPGRQVDPTKLMEFLKRKFGIGAYEIHVSILHPFIKNERTPLTLSPCVDGMRLSIFLSCFSIKPLPMHLPVFVENIVSEHVYADL
jgi:hypothetical protein